MLAYYCITGTMKTIQYSLPGFHQLRINKSLSFSIIDGITLSAIDKQNAKTK